MPVAARPLTDAIVRNAKPRDGKAVELADGASTGLSLVVIPGAKVSKIWRLRFRVAGERKRVTIGRYPDFSLAEARAEAGRLRREVDQGGDPASDRAQRREAPTVLEACERYMSEHARPKRKPRTADGYQAQIDKHIGPAIGKVRIGELTRAKVEALHRKIGKDAPGAANRVIALLSAVCVKAEIWGWRPGGSNPCRKIEKFRGKKMERFLDAAERARLEAALVKAEKAGKVATGSIHAIRLLTWTGCRLGEIVGLTWDMVDVERACLRLPDSKTGAKVVPLAPQAVALLRGLGRTSQYVCPSETGGELGNLQRAWRVIRKTAKLEDVRIHDLRHSFASDALNAGAPLALVGALLGHRSVLTTARYAHVADEALRRAAEAAGNAIEASTRTGAKREKARP